MVEVALYRSADSLKMSKLKLHVLCKGMLSVPHSMRLNISLCNHIKTIFVTQRIPERIVRIVTCSYRIHIKLLHDKDILYHVGLTYHIAFIRVDLMPVHTFDEYWLAIYKKLTSNYFHITETNLD